MPSMWENVQPGMHAGKDSQVNRTLKLTLQESAKKTDTNECPACRKVVNQKWTQKW